MHGANDTACLLPTVIFCYKNAFYYILLNYVYNNNYTSNYVTYLGGSFPDTSSFCLLGVLSKDNADGLMLSVGAMSKKRYQMLNDHFNVSREKHFQFF
jgi:hypothetical protein